MTFPKILAALMIATAGCAANPGDKTPASAADFGADEPIYGTGLEAPARPEDDTVALSACRYGADVANFAKLADATGAEQGIVEYSLAGALITVQLTDADADLHAVTNAVYSRQVNAAQPPFYGYGIGGIDRDGGSESFAFAVKDASRPDAEGHRLFVDVRRDAPSGRVLVFTAAWPFERFDEASEARLRELAARQYLSCS
jgi:hypothetical protein